MKKEPPAVSVLMPVRNGDSNIGAAIESITKQNFENWELIIINDGSTDFTESIVAEAAKHDARIHWLTTPHIGIAHALNLGIVHCRALWIARMDADDAMTSQRLELQLDFAMKNPGLSLVSGLVTHGGEHGGFSIYVDWMNSVITAEEIALKRFIESPVAHPSVMFRRDLIDRYGGYRHGDFPEDYELWLRWLGQGVKFGKVPHPVITWNDSANRLTRSDPRYHPTKFYETKLRYLAAWIVQNVDPVRQIWLWGAGRVTRKRFSTLPAYGIKISGYIDIDSKKCGSRRDGIRVVLPNEIPRLYRPFIITCVAKRGARELIQTDLESRGLVEGRDFIHAA